MPLQTVKGAVDLLFSGGSGGTGTRQLEAGMAFLIIFGLGLFLTIVTFVVGELFGGDAGADTGGGGVDTASPSPFSSRILFVFLTAFGGFGYLAYSMDVASGLAAAIGVAGGLAVAAGTFFLIIAPMARQQGLVKVSSSDYVGQEAEVTLEIPDGGLGRVRLIAPGSGARVAQPARAEDGGRIAAGERVRVTSSGASSLTVERIVVAPPAGGAQRQGEEH